MSPIKALTLSKRILEDLMQSYLTSISFKVIRILLTKVRKLENGNGKLAVNFAQVINLASTDGTHMLITFGEQAMRRSILWLHWEGGCRVLVLDLKALEICFTTEVVLLYT